MSSLSEQIMALHAEGKSYNQIKEQLGCSKGTISYHLGAGQREKTLTRSRDIRSSITKHIQSVKQETPCADCKENYPYWVMEFDHLDNKSFTISHFKHTTYSLDRVKAEIAKCEVVCANCHKNRTYLRMVKTGNSSLDVSASYLP
jgi:transposase